MFLKCFFIAAALLILAAPNGYSQSDDFCGAVTAILHDASNQFRNVKGRMTESNMNATMWAASITVPGAINTRFVESMGLFYECAFYQTREKTELKGLYDKFRDRLSACLLPQGYKLSKLDNFYPGLGDYKKLVYMQEPADVPGSDTIKHSSRLAPGHVTMEADYSKETGKYTVVMFIFEH
jgi:hypothetical protein